MDKDELSFALFFQVWANIKGWNVPDIHYQVIEFLDDSDNWNNRSAVLQVFRSAGKSTILGLFIVYLLVKNPALRILVLSADSKTAKKIVADAQSIISQHPLARHLLNRSGVWRSDCFNVLGATDARNFSLEASGITSNVTGARTDFIIHDDVEVPKNCETEGKRDSLRSRIAEASNLLIAKTGKRLFVGTPHAFDSIYPEFIDVGCSSLRIPLLVNPQGEFLEMTGDCAWAEQFPPEEVINRQIQGKTKGNFYSQYLLIPASVDDGVLDPAKCIEYTEEIQFGFANNSGWSKIGDKQIVSVSAFWDVSPSKSQGDDSVVAIVFFSADGHIYIHRTVDMHGDIREQCKQCADLLQQFNVPMIVVETNGVGAFVPEFLMQHTAAMGIGVEGRHTSQHKGEKILENFEVPLSAQILHISSQVASSKFLQQMRDFRPNFFNVKNHDDYIDASASAIKNEPIRISSISFESDYDVELNWSEGGSSNTYEAEYVVL